MQNRDWRRPFRYLWRLPLLLLHVTLGLAITVLLLGPIGRALRWRGEPVGAAPAWWSSRCSPTSGS